jgi:hypothetical protein
MKLGVRAEAALAAFLLSFLIIGSVSYSAPITETHYPLNNGWNGCSQIYAMTPRPQLLYSYQTPLPNATALIAIIGPTIPFQSSETAELRSFLQNGGTVLLADDFGTGNGLLQSLNVSARFSGQALADLYFYSKAPSFPLVSDFVPDPLNSNITALILDHPTYIEILNPSLVKAVALSSPFSFADLHNNDTLSPNEKTQAYPVIATTHIGAGLLVLVANANMFDNELIELFNNQLFFRNLLRIASGTTVFDLAHLKSAPLTNPRITFRKELDTSLTILYSTVVQGSVVAGLILVFAGVFLVMRRRRRTRGYPTQESTLHTDPTYRFKEAE